MGVGAILVLHEEVGAEEFADIVVEPTHRRQQGIGPDGLGSGLCQGGDVAGVVIGARCLPPHPLQEGMGGIQ